MEEIITWKFLFWKKTSICTYIKKKNLYFCLNVRKALGGGWGLKYVISFWLPIGTYMNFTAAFPLRFLCIFLPYTNKKKLLTTCIYMSYNVSLPLPSPQKIKCIYFSFFKVHSSKKSMWQFNLKKTIDKSSR